MVGKKIPGTIALACLNLAAFIVLGGRPFGFFLRMDMNLETILLAVSIFWLPLVTLVSIAAQTRFGWYAGLALPACYLLVALLLHLFATHGIMYDRFYAAYTKEYLFYGCDGMALLSSLAFFYGLVLTPTLVALLTPSARHALLRKPTPKNPL